MFQNAPPPSRWIANLLFRLLRPNCMLLDKGRCSFGIDTGLTQCVCHLRSGSKPVEAKLSCYKILSSKIGGLPLDSLLETYCTQEPVGSTPILRTLSLSPILGQRSVHVEAQAL